MKTLFTSILIFFYSLSYSQNNWFQQTSGITNNLNSIFFINTNTGWATGSYGVIIKTTNGGMNWFIQNSNTNLTLYEISFADQNTGWAVGGDYSIHPLCLDTVVIVKTTNGGANWNVNFSGYSYIYNDLSVVNENTAFITNRGYTGVQFCFSSTGIIQKTSNSGTNWNLSLHGAGFNSVHFINSMTGWAAEAFSTDYPFAIYKINKTSNGGLNWQTLTTDTAYSFPYNYKRIRFLNETTGYIIKNNLKKSTNGGTNWQNTDSGSTANINSYYFVNPDTGWCFGNAGKIIRTNNGGTNWTIQTSNTTQRLTCTHFVNSLTGWAAGQNGTILKTITGGLTSVSNISNEIPADYSLEQNYPNPFNPATTISYQISNNGLVKIKVYDILGKEVTTLVNEFKQSGRYTVEFSATDGGSNLPSGIYFYKLEAESTEGRFSETKRMTLLK